MTLDEANKRVYYGTIKEIWELDYVKVKVALFRCAWIPLGHVSIDEYRKTCVNRTTIAYHADPFILAIDATQIFFVDDPLHRNCHLVMHGKRRVLGVDDVADQDEYDEFVSFQPRDHTPARQRSIKSSENPSSFGVNVLILVPPCTWELSRKTSIYAYPAT